MISDTGTCHAIFDTWYLHRYLPCYIWHMISDTGTCHAIFDTWYLTPVLTMLYLTLDIRHRYLTCYTWHLISDIGTWHVITWHLIPDTWYMILDNWHAITHLTCFHLILVHLTWYYDTWLVTITPDTCITWHIMIIYRDLAWLLYCYQSSGTPELLYSWTHESLILIPHAPLLLLIT